MLHMIIPEKIPEGLYKIKDVAELFSVKAPTVQLWIKLGKLSASETPGGKRLRVPHEWILEFIENHIEGNHKGTFNESTIRYRILNNLRSRLSHALKGKMKSKSTKKFLGCSFEDLLKYIENQFKPGMTWKNYGRGGWSIDHIIPCAKFDLSRTDHQKVCFHYLNLRPMWASENSKKNAKVTRRNIAKVTSNFHKLHKTS